MAEKTPIRGKSIFRIAVVTYFFASLAFLYLTVHYEIFDIIDSIGLVLGTPVVVFMIPFIFLPTIFIIGTATGTPEVSFVWAWQIFKRNILVYCSIVILLSVFICYGLIAADLT